MCFVLLSTQWFEPMLHANHEWIWRASAPLGKPGTHYCAVRDKICYFVTQICKIWDGASWGQNPSRWNQKPLLTTTKLCIFSVEVARPLAWRDEISIEIPGFSLNQCIQHHQKQLLSRVRFPKQDETKGHKRIQQSRTLLSATHDNRVLSGHTDKKQFLARW